jgi:putative transcription factor
LYQTNTNFQGKGAATEGQRLTKVDRSDDIIAPNKVSPEIGQNIRNRRSKEGPYKMTQADLAKKVNAQANDIKLLEGGDAIKNQALLNKVARVLKISPKTGLPLDEK